jgi:hypothetical protein
MKKCLAYSVCIGFNSVNFTVFRFLRDNELEIGRIVLTKTGQQLCNVCGSKQVDGFIDYVFETWVKKSIAISSPYTPKK